MLIATGEKVNCKQCNRELEVKLIRPRLCKECAAKRESMPSSLSVIGRERKRHSRIVLSPEYKQYMESDEWNDRRLKVLERDEYVCQACWAQRATEVHHLIYDHLFNEPLFDLVSVCHDCHEMLTQHDREAREDFTSEMLPLRWDG